MTLERSTRGSSDRWEHEVVERAGWSHTRTVAVERQDGGGVMLQIYDDDDGSCNAIPLDAAATAGLEAFLAAWRAES